MIACVGEFSAMICNVCNRKSFIIQEVCKYFQQCQDEDVETLVGYYAPLLNQFIVALTKQPFIEFGATASTVSL